jgi:hypothetical protein
MTRCPTACRPACDFCVHTKAHVSDYVRTYVHVCINTYAVLWWMRTCSQDCVVYGMADCKADAYPIKAQSHCAEHSLICTGRSVQVVL